MAPNLHEFLGRLKSLFRKQRLDREMAEELEFHQTLLREKLLRQGVPQSQVDRATRQTFGNPNRWQERLRELWQFRTAENLLRDVSFSLRLLKKSPGFTAIAVLTLALGVGANTAVFSLINGLLLRPLPVPHAEQLAVLSFEEGGPQPEYEFCTPFFRSLETRHDVFSDIFAYNTDTLQVRGQSGNENIHGMLVSGQFFTALQTPPLLGRYLTPEDDQPGGSVTGLAVVLSESFWERWFNRALDVVGRKLIIANVPFTVVGVMPKRFIGADPTQRPQIFAPLSADPIIDAPRNHIDDGIHAWWLTVLARRQPGASLEQANAALQTISIPILHESSSDPQFISEKEKGHFHFAAESGSRGFTFIRTLFRKPLTIMFWMCGGILLLACLNLASLLMARSAARERELATRLAMGATRRRLVQQLIVESMLIAVIGTAVGIAAAPTVSHFLAAMLSSGESAIQLDASLDFRVLAFAALIAVISTLLIGLVPALQSTRRDLNDHIKEGQHASHLQERRSILPRILLACEVALALVLVVGAGLLATSVVKLYESGTGFDPKGLVNIAFSMDKQGLQGDQLMQLYQQLGDNLSHQPGVRNASFEFIVPLSHRGWNGRYAAPGQSAHMIWLNSVAPRYFETMRIPLYQGRDFTWGDTKASGLKIILNEAAAKQFFPGRNAVGQQVIYSRTKTSFEVVAIVGDAKYRDIRTPAPPAGYVPIMQDEQPKPSLNAVVRIDGPQTPLVAAARSITARLAPSIPAPTMTTMDDVVDNSMSAERMMALLTVFFAACALLVTAIGLYGTLAYSTARRTSEIGIRMALGAQRARVVALVFRENAVVAFGGCGAGLIAAILASRALASFLYETSPRDPWILFGSVAALTAIASAASLLPALRAARIEPISAIRCE
ncbi:ABC transporter permease [Acidicapsa acidisoli]|uniref:ABC transporter permease n=1 Tax=Acidicapsa acidisoli TaxID=1615681 RepID=UPI0021DFE344|nr:ABC transporter permease [Acidicapsa acidisoli]